MHKALTEELLREFLKLEVGKERGGGRRMASLTISETPLDEE